MLVTAVMTLTYMMNQFNYVMIFTENKATDTTSIQLGEPTYVANRKTFEQDIMDKMGIVERKQRGKTYWY